MKKNLFAELSAEQNLSVILITKKPKTSGEQLIEIVRNRQAFYHWMLSKEEYKQEADQSIISFWYFSEYTFENGDTIRITDYQLNDFHEYED